MHGIALSLLSTCFACDSAPSGASLGVMIVKLRELVDASTDAAVPP